MYGNQWLCSVMESVRSMMFRLLLLGCFLALVWYEAAKVTRAPLVTSRTVVVVGTLNQAHPTFIVGITM